MKVETKEVKKKEVNMLEGFNLKKFLMEFVGSFAIVYFGNWSQIFCDMGSSNLIAVALTVGLMMTVFTWIGSGVSGAHFNPVTTLSMVFLKRVGMSTGFIYLIFQLLGGILAGAIIYIQVPQTLFDQIKKMNGLGLPTPDKRFTSESVWTEMIATFFFQIAVMSLHLDKRAPKDVHAIGTGAMMALGILTIGHISGGGINPARVFGPSIITGNLGNDIFVFIVGPVCGSLLAAFLYREVFMVRKVKEEVKDKEAQDEEDDEFDFNSDDFPAEDMSDEEKNNDEKQADESIVEKKGE